jgi:hypothetical protein
LEGPLNIDFIVSAVQKFGVPILLAPEGQHINGSQRINQPQGAHPNRT